MTLENPEEQQTVGQSQLRLEDEKSTNCETNNAKILSSYITSNEESTNTEVTLKINTSNLSSIIRTFERYDYQVKAAFQDKDAEEDLRNRFDALMNFMKF